MIWLRCLLMWGELRKSWVGKLGGVLETWSWTRGDLKRDTNNTLNGKTTKRH